MSKSIAGHTTPPDRAPSARRNWAWGDRRWLQRDERGATLLEFTIVLVPFFVLLFGIFEVAFVFWASYELENATDDAARMIRTGQVQTGKLDETAFKQQLCSHVSVLVNCTSKLRIDVQSCDSFAALSPPSAFNSDGTLKSGLSFAPGAPNQVVLVTAFYEWPLMNVIAGISLSNMASGNRLLRASSAFRNEPFPEE